MVHSGKPGHQPLMGRHVRLPAKVDPDAIGLVVVSMSSAGMDGIGVPAPRSGPHPRWPFASLISGNGTPNGVLDMPSVTRTLLARRPSHTRTHLFCRRDHDAIAQWVEVGRERAVTPRGTASEGPARTGGGTAGEDCRGAAPALASGAGVEPFPPG